MILPGSRNCKRGPMPRRLNHRARFCARKSEGIKSEIRISKSETNSNDRKFQTPKLALALFSRPVARQSFGAFGFEIWNLFRISDFALRIFSRKTRESRMVISIKRAVDAALI